MSELTAFIHGLGREGIVGVARAKAVLWRTGRSENCEGLDVRAICEAIETAGHPKQNEHRLDKQLARDADAVRVPGGRAWRLHPRARTELDKVLQSIDARPIPIAATDSVVPRSLFSNTRGYIERVVSQINASYDAGLYDCSAVMCRRLLETLIIEAYERDGRADAIKKDGRFYMFGDLLRIISTDPAFNLGRNAKKGLEDFKRLGDSSAHDRRFNARRSDIDDVRNGMRSASEELLHLARLI